MYSGVLPFCLLALVTTVAAQTDPQRDFVSSGKNAYIMLPPEFIYGPKVKMVTWSADGMRLAAVREVSEPSISDVQTLITGQEQNTPPVEQQIQVIAWNTVTRKT